MKVLFIVWSYTSGGGAEKILNNLVNYLAQKGYKIDILEYWHSNHIPLKINKNVKLLEPIVSSKSEYRLVRIIKLFFAYCFPFLLRKRYANEKYDIEISFNYMIPTFLLSKKCKKVAWIHGDIYDLRSSKFKYLIQKKYLKRVDNIVAISENTYKSVSEIYPQYNEKLLIINNLYDFNEIIKKSEDFSIENFKKIKTILFLGRFDENKNPLFLIRVMKKIKYRYVNLVLIGQGQLKETIEKEIEANNLTDKVHMLNYQPNPYPYIKNAYVLLCSSYSEGFPTTLVEGMILGKPFVSTKVGGSVELSNNNKCGFISNDVDDFAFKIDKLLNDDKLYFEMSNNCTNFIQKYSLDYQGKKVDSLFKNLVHNYDSNLKEVKNENK